VPAARLLKVSPLDQTQAMLVIRNYAGSGVTLMSSCAYAQAKGDGQDATPQVLESLAGELAEPHTRDGAPIAQVSVQFP
jgi:hypothetical protein